jgi:class II lanthipeptide synthase
MGSLLDQICELGLEHGRKQLREKVSTRLLEQVSKEAMKSLEDSLGRTLADAVAQCVDLYSNALRSAAAALAIATPRLSAQAKHSYAVPMLAPELLLKLFREFRALPELWSDLISAWCYRVEAFLLRMHADRMFLTKSFFRGCPPGKVLQLDADLSDPHNRGERVVALEFEAGPLIYKPRGGDGEWEWFAVLDWINREGHTLGFLTLKVLRRKGYCWMEPIAPVQCKSQAEARRFYRRIGGLLCVGHLLRIVDCHCENMIAAGEYPVFVDTETLWHLNNTFSPNNNDALLETGLLPLPRSYPDSEYPCSPLGNIEPGPYTPCLNGKPLSATRYVEEIEKGFSQTWCWLLENEERQAALLKRIRRIAQQQHRRLYWPTLKYITIREASLRPTALRSSARRSLLLQRWCKRKGVAAAVVQDEVEAIARLDIPYFLRTSSVSGRLPDPLTLPKLVQSLRSALQR